MNFLFLPEGERIILQKGGGALRQGGEIMLQILVRSYAVSVFTFLGNC